MFKSLKHKCYLDPLFNTEPTEWCIVFLYIVGCLIFSDRWLLRLLNAVFLEAVTVMKMTGVWSRPFACHSCPPQKRLTWDSCVTLKTANVPALYMKLAFLSAWLGSTRTSFIILNILKTCLLEMKSFGWDLKHLQEPNKVLLLLTQVLNATVTCMTENPHRHEIGIFVFLLAFVWQCDTDCVMPNFLALVWSF